MTALVETTNGVSVKSVTPNLGKNIIEVTLPVTFVWGTDTIAIDLAAHGGSLLTGWMGFAETTAGSIVIPATGTTAVSTTTATITPTASGTPTCGGTIFLFFK